MRKLKLQVQLSVDGFNGGLSGELDWMTWDWGDDIKKYVNDLHEECDTILLGRKMTDGFISHWEGVLKNPSDESYPFAKKMVDYPKVVFTKTLDRSKWNNTEIATGDLSEEVNKLKRQNGKDIIVYGGSGFVSSLIKENLIDEYYLFINPSALGKGMTIFSGIDIAKGFKLIGAKGFDCGIVLMHYVPK
jgi:dihydrofolate reductase